MVSAAFAASGGCDGAGNCYIRAGASGSGSGADWTNAYTGFGKGAGEVDPSAMSRGVTYWIANGVYGAQTFSTPDSGVSVITVEGATASSHGPAPDWSDSYAGQATFIGDNAISTDYWTFNGQSRGSDWQSGYTIKFWNQKDGSGAALNLSGVSNIALEYVEIEGTGDGFPNNSTADRCNPNGGTGSCPPDNGGVWVDNGIYEGSPDTNLYIGYSYVHHTGNTQFQMNASGSGGSVNNNTTWEYDWISYNHTGMNAGHDEAYSLYGSNVTIRYNVFQDIAGTGTITTAGAGQPSLQNWYVYGNLFFWDPAYAKYNGDYYLAINDLGIIAFLGEKMSGSVVFANNTIAGMYNAEMDAPGAGAATYAIGTNNSSPSQGGSTCGSTCPTVTVEDNLWVGDGYANGSSYCNTVKNATCNYDYNAAWEDSVPNGSNWQTDGHTHDYNVSGATNPFVNIALSTIAGYELITPDPFASNAGTSLTNAGTYWNGSSNATNTYTVDMLNVARGADGTWDRGALQSPSSNLGTLQSIAVTPANPSILTNNTEQFTATGTYSSGKTADLTASVTWTSGNTGVVSINNAGLATGLAAGTSTISATLGSVSGSTVLTVTAATLQSISVTPANASIATGLTQQYTATGTYNNGVTQNITGSVTWTSSNPGAATIAAGGLASAVAAGTTTITATLGSVAGATTLTVTAPALQSIAVTPVDAFVAAGGTEQYTATGTYSNGSTQNITGSVMWTSSNPGAATIAAGGLASAVAAGTTTITATSGSVTGSTLLTVTAAALQSISVTPANASAAAGTTVQYTATGTFGNGAKQNITNSVRWTSSSSGTATINASGLATGVAAGSTTITATSGSISGATTLTVTAPALQSIAVTPATASIAAGATQQYTATGTYSNGSTQNITGAVTWTSSNAAAATINASGLATGVAAGSTTITATSGSIAGTASLTVSGSSSGSPSFRLGASPSTLTIAHGSSGTETITAAPAGGYTGTVLLTVDFGSADSTLANLCAGFGSSQSLQGSIAVAGTSPATTTLTLDANAADCADAAAVSRTGLHPLKQSASMAKLGPENRRPELPGPLPAGASFAGLVMIGYLGRRSRRLRNTTAVLILLAAAFTLSACGGQISLVGSASQTITNPQPGTYTGTITGHDSANAAITNTTTFTLVIQ
jgi:uncharacterized protein YjdB